jgi:uncharacterized protein YdeI (YjbR/CyaY-like superfamily)
LTAAVKIPSPLVFASDRDEWRSWLKKHHADKREAWLAYYKKHTGKPSVSYRESVEEALCFGWIDGLKKRIDEERYAHRFTPRKANSKWSPLNIRLARELAGRGRMTSAGLAAFERRRAYDDSLQEVRNTENFRLPRDIEKVLKANRTAWKHYNELAPGYRKQYIAWLLGAKKADTRERRLIKAVRMLEQNIKPGMK